MDKLFIGQLVEFPTILYSFSPVSQIPLYIGAEGEVVVGGLQR